MTMNTQQKQQIEANKTKSERNELGWMAAIAISTFLFIVAIAWQEYRSHSLMECEQACFEKITGQKAPNMEELQDE